MMKKQKIEKNNYRGFEIEDSILTATEPEAARIEPPIEKIWMRFFWLIIIICWSVLTGRVFYLSYYKGSYYREVSEENRIRLLPIKAPRGKIFDRFGNILVNNIPSIDATVIPADLPKNSEDRKEVAKKVSDILGLNEGEVWGMIENLNMKSLSPVLLKENISRDESLIMAEKEQDIQGVKMDKTAVREYYDSFIFSHILGYEGKIKKEELKDNPEYLMTDSIGKQGIEKSYEKELKGMPGARQVEVDSLGNIKREIGVKEPAAGNDLVLNIDAELQKKLSDELSKIIELTKTKTAAAAAVNPQSGEILALVSLPSFDNNLFAKGISFDEYLEIISDPGKILFNRTVAGEYPPGSIIKPLVAIAALEEKTINETTTLLDQGSINVGGYAFRDWKAHGQVDVRKAIAESCDVFFYSVGGGYYGIEGLGIGRMKKYFSRFGLGKKTGIDIPSESEGLVPDEQWKMENTGEKWYIGNSFHAAIGQGFISATPIQLVSYISAIANGGTLYQPRIVSYVKKSDGEKIANSVKIIGKNLASKKSIDIAREGMRQAVTSGTAISLSNLSVEAAGKTGTAQFGAEGKTHAWFASFAPYNNPRIAMVILVEGGGEGHSSAVPVTKEVYNWYFNPRTSF